MKTLQEWQKEFAESATKKFSNNSRWSEQDRVLSILRQLADVGGAIQKEQGIFVSDNHAHKDPNHRIAALIADTFILCEKRKINLDTELSRVLEWYQKMEETKRINLKDEGVIMQLLSEALDLIVITSERISKKECHYFLEHLILSLRQMGYYFTQTDSPLYSQNTSLTEYDKDVIKKIKNIRDAICHRESEENFVTPVIKLVGVFNFKDNDVEVQYGTTKIFLVRDILSIHHKFRELFSNIEGLEFLARNPIWDMDEERLKKAEDILIEKLKDPVKLLELRRSGSN